jgi:molybdopterin-guanine dinucleotide biosynthesis protein A
MIGVVLCGEQSEQKEPSSEEMAWAESLAQKFEQMHLPFCISIRPDQAASYGEHFETERLVLDAFALSGSLQGLLSVHNQFPFHDIFLVGSHLRDVPLREMEGLLQEFRNHDGEHDFLVYKKEEEWEPTFGIYSREGLQKVFDLYSLAQLEKKSMEYVLEMSNTLAYKTLDSTEAWILCKTR